MKKIILHAGLVTTLFTTAAFAHVEAEQTAPQQEMQLAANESTTTAIPSATPSQPAPTNTNTTTSTPSTTTDQVPTGPATPQQPPASTDTPSPAPTSTGNEGNTNVIPAQEPTKPSTPAVIDCNYHIPPETTVIDSKIILVWAEKAAQQSFNFDPSNIDDQVNGLKACFTDQGWKGFQDALDKSGNISAIKAQQLTVSSMIDGTGTVEAVKDNQWKATLPLQVVYQNEKQKLTQNLTIDLVIGRKANGDLGIMQIIAAPRQTAAPATPDTSTPTSPIQEPASAPATTH